MFGSPHRALDVGRVMAVPEPPLGEQFFSAAPFQGQRFAVTVFRDLEPVEAESEAFDWLPEALAHASTMEGVVNIEGLMY